MSRTTSRAIALVALTATTFGFVTPVANAAPVKVQGDTCTFTLSKLEKAYFNENGSTPPLTMDARDALNLAASYENGANLDKAGLENLKLQYDQGGYLGKDKNQEEARKQYNEDVRQVKFGLAVKESMATAMTFCTNPLGPNSKEEFSPTKVYTYNDPNLDKDPDPSLLRPATPPDTNKNQTNQTGQSALSTADGQLNETGIGVVVGGVLALLLALGGAAFAMMQGMLG
ncbi:hypothetical protein [Corynebacterium pyruviciproducens]|uniref:Uncharacterized protein n=1 Tax=Corynebacterium pyruviciproducens TaxID=598660 RepID=A0AAF1BRB6_9CORY|nr:hypothetical protein [Corynebacterium pyruviciproducens]WOT01608.1 hypothetical protein CYJ47_10080 [Corynebacterium pyruviciproducens]